MSEIQEFIEEMKQKYGEQVVVKASACEGENLAEVPEPLKEFYAFYDFIELPFGRIDSVKEAIWHSNSEEPFKSEGWFCFGFDGYFSFWLCSYQADKDGLWITPWDHDADETIEGVYSTLVEFLKDVESEYQDES